MKRPRRGKAKRRSRPAIETTSAATLTSDSMSAGKAQVREEQGVEAAAAVEGSSEAAPAPATPKRLDVSTLTRIARNYLLRSSRNFPPTPNQAKDCVLAAAEPSPPPSPPPPLVEAVEHGAEAEVSDVLVIEGERDTEEVIVSPEDEGLESFLLAMLDS